MFKVGQKVVCVEDKPNSNTIVPNRPVKGEIYTIRAIRTNFNIYGVLLVEVVNPLQEFMEGLYEGAFDPSRFRPVDTTYGEQLCEELERITEPELV